MWASGPDQPLYVDVRGASGDDGFRTGVALRRFASALDRPPDSLRSQFGYLPTVVFVHGVMDRSTSFNRVRSQLGDVITVAYDRRGYARSEGVSAHRALFADQCGDLRSIINGQAHVLIVGHSYGAVVAVGVAIESGTEQIEGLLAYEPPMSWAPWWPASAGSSTLAIADAHGPEAAAEAFMRRIVGSHIWERLPIATRQARLHEGEALIADLRSLRTGPPPFSLADCGVPAVVAYGSESLAHHQRAAQEFAAGLPNVELAVVTGAGHGAHSSHPQEFAALVRRTLLRSGWNSSSNLGGIPAQEDTVVRDSR